MSPHACNSSTQEAEAGEWSALAKEQDSTGGRLGDKKYIDKYKSMTSHTWTQGLAPQQSQ